MARKLRSLISKHVIDATPPRCTWDFGSVNSEHLYACFLWEYYMHIPGYVEAVQRYERERMKLFRTAEKIKPGFPPLPSPETFSLRSHPPHGDFLEYWPSTSFAALPSEIRDLWLQYSSCEYWMLARAPRSGQTGPEDCPITADLGPLLPKISTLIEEWGIETFSRTSSQSLLLYLENSPSEQLVGFTVDWRFSNHQLICAFKEWVRRFKREYVPEVKLDGAGNPSRKLRALLKKLGAYRLVEAFKEPEAAYVYVNEVLNSTSEKKPERLYGTDASTWRKAHAAAQRVIASLKDAVMVKSRK